MAEDHCMKDGRDRQTLEMFSKLERARERSRAREQALTQAQAEQTPAAPAPAFSISPTATPTAHSPPKEQPTAKILMFPGWVDEKRAGPDICMRSALFGVVRPGRRHWCRDETLAAVSGYTVRWSGERLDQGDLDIWLQLLHMLRDQPIGGQVYFSPRGVLRTMGRNTGKSDREWLFRGLDRLAGGVATLESDRFRVRSSLMGWGIDKETERCFASPHKELLPLFQRDTYTLLDFEQRLLVDSQLGRWLHEFYSTHAKPHAYKVETLRDLCGSEAGVLRKFRQELRRSLQELVTVGSLVSWKIDAGDLVQVKKRPSASQARHLVSKAMKIGKQPRKTRKLKREQGHE